MHSFQELLSLGAGNAWLFIPSAVLLGALHGLEPGHSKTMMAAFIIAIRGTVWQAVLLGACAAFSHSLVIWGLAAAGLLWGQQWNAETTEPYFLLVSGILVIGSALWMAWRTHRDVKAASSHKHDRHEHDHSEAKSHSHDHSELAGLNEAEFVDAHEREHALQIQKRFATREVTTGQIMLFGLTGGLLPCPAALTVLLLCLQLKEFTLGFSMVVCFSLGLAITLVATGSLAAWSVNHATRKFKGFSNFIRRAPYFSSALLVILGLVMIVSGLRHLS